MKPTVFDFKIWPLRIAWWRRPFSWRPYLGTVWGEGHLFAWRHIWLEV